jgi:hypothetical protein
MNWKEYLKSQGYTDAEISTMETSFGADKMAKAFAQPIQQLADAQRDLAAAKTEREEFQTWYETDVLPKVGDTYKDAINWRTRAAAAEERLKAAKDYGFLSEPVVPGTQPGQPVVNPVPGSPANPNPNPAGAGDDFSRFDSRYVRTDNFTEQVNNIPTMLGRLTKISNEHMALFGSPLLDIDTIISEAQASKGKRNVLDIWEEKYKVKDKRAQIEADKQAAHDKQVADEAIRKYASEHNMPFTAPGQPSRVPLFTPSSTTEARQPWKGARERKEERKQKLVDALSGRTSANAGTGTGTRVQ